MTSNFGKNFGRLVQELRLARGMTQAELAEAIELTPVALSRLENGHVVNPRSKTVKALGEKLGFNLSDVLELRDGNSLERVLANLTTAASTSRDSDKEDALRNEYGSLAEALLSANEVNRDGLELLAYRFGASNLPDQSDDQLREFLTQKAEEYRAYRDLIEGIDQRTAGVGNLKLAAKDAAERLDFDEVEELLARVDQVETEIAAETKELRASNALLRNRSEQAFQLFCDAADSFRALDPLEAADRRDRYRRVLYGHGLRYGGSGLRLAIEIMRPAIAAISNQTDKERRVKYLNNIAIALDAQGEREAGPRGAELFQEAISTYREILGVISQRDDPEEWAWTQNNLSIALTNQGTRTGGPEGARLLAEAVAAYRAALTIRTEADHRVDWAATQNNLGIALRNQGTRTGGPEGARLLGEAVAAYRAALTVYTEAVHPVDWAMTQNNLGIALQEQGARTGGAEGARLLGEAVEAYRAALTVYTEADHPVDWAMTKNNLGNALGDQGIRTGGPEGARLLGEAVAAFRAALTVRTRDNDPVAWAETRENLAITEQSIADHDTTADPRPHLEAALAHVEAALTVYDPEHMSHDHGTATDLRDRLAARLAALGG